MQRFILYILLFVNFSSQAQLTKEDYFNTIDNKIFAYSKQKPDATFDSVVAYVNKTMTVPSDKVRAYYTWIALNISYNTSHLKNLNLFQTFGINSVSSSGQKPDEVFKTKQAVCEGYSNLMAKFCHASSIPCYTVCGYVKTDGGEIPKLLHAWNVVKIDTAWSLLDVTWSSGYLNMNYEYVKRFSNAYFAPKANEFVKDHFPLDPLWQLLAYPYTKHEFEVDSFTIKNKLLFNFRDSLKIYQSKTDLEQTELNYIHYYKYEPSNEFYAKNLDIHYNNQYADKLNIANLYHSDFISIAEKKLSKTPTLPDWKKAKAALDSADLYYKKTEEHLLQYKAKTTEYQTIFESMQKAIIENRKNVKVNTVYLKKLKPFLVKR